MHNFEKVIDFATLYYCRTDGITQNDLAKELGIKNNDIFYVLKGLESRGLIVRQSTIIRKKEAGNEGEYKSGSIVNTNMLHLYRYAKHLGHLQRLEITKEDKTSIDNENDDKEVATGDGVSEERIADFVPALRAICDRLEKANGKVILYISANSLITLPLYFYQVLIVNHFYAHAGSRHFRSEEGIRLSQNPWTQSLEKCKLMVYNVT